MFFKVDSGAPKRLSSLAPKSLVGLHYIGNTGELFTLVGDSYSKKVTNCEVRGYKNKSGLYANSSSSPGAFALKPAIAGRSLTNVAVAISTAGSTIATTLYSTTAASKNYLEINTTSRTTFQVRVRTDGFGSFTSRDYTVDDTSQGVFVFNWTAPYTFEAWFNGVELTPSSSTDTGSPGYVAGDGEYLNPIGTFLSGAGGFNAIAIFEKTIPSGLAREISKDIFSLTKRNSLLYLYTSSSIVRPSSDITTTGWTANGGPSSLYDCINDASYSDTDYILSPAITGTPGPCVMGLSTSLAAGNYTLSLRGKYNTSSSQAKATLLSAADADVGSTGWQTLNSSYTTHSLAVTCTGTATKVKIEVQ